MKVGLMGFGRGGRLVADALRASSWCELVAAAGSGAARLERFRLDHPGVAVYDDYRSLIVENALDALFVAVPPFVRGRYLALAAQRGLPVWMVTPAARRLDEALALMEQFERAECPLVVSREWGIEESLQPEAVGLTHLGRLFFARGNVMTCWSDDLDWRGDSVRAGGGVLLDRGYGLVDTLVQVMGVPSTIYAAARGVSRPGGRYPYDTEDTAAVVCQFTGGAIAVISACWTSGPTRTKLEIHGAGGAMHVDATHVRIRDRSGQTEVAAHVRGANPFIPQIETFLSGLSSGKTGMLSAIRQHLATMAVIQAAYLSVRTGQPESPATIFQMHDVKETAIASSSWRDDT
jgi:predicted dehydrogenase